MPCSRCSLSEKRHWGVLIYTRLSCHLHDLWVLTNAILLPCGGVKLLKLLTSPRSHRLKSLVYFICLIELWKCESTCLFFYLAEDWVVFVVHLLLHFLMNLYHRVFPIYYLEAHRLSFSLLPHRFLALIVRYSLSSLYYINLIIAQKNMLKYNVIRNSFDARTYRS